MNSYSINKLYELTPDVDSPPTDLPNPLTEVESLREAELVDIRLAAQRARVGLLFDLRGALGFSKPSDPNAGLVVLTSVSGVDWSDTEGLQHAPDRWMSRWGDWEPSVGDGAYTIRTGGATHMLTVTAARAEIYLGSIEDLDQRPVPDTAKESAADIIAGFPQWSSTMLVTEHHRYP